MAIKDIIVPAFVGTTTIKWIPTRGFATSSPTYADSGATWILPSQDKNWTLANLCKNWELPTQDKAWTLPKKR